MNIVFIILAAGESKRFKSKIPKPYHIYNGKPLIEHSIDKVKNYKKFNKILLVINKKHRKFLNGLNIKKTKIIEGGKTRAESAFIAIKSIKNQKINKVLIHDAARPNFSIKLINNIIQNLKFNSCVVPAIKTNDSVKLKYNNKIINLKRENVYHTQTPQGFKYKELVKLHNNKSADITDDSNIFISAGKKIKIIKGEIFNKKITTNLDIKNNNLKNFGLGFDIHRLVPKKKTLFRWN